MFAGLRNKQYDTDKDGKVSQEEYLAAMTKRFQDMDTNKDGALTQEEFTAGRRGMGGRQGAPGADAGGHRGERGGGR